MRFETNGIKTKIIFISLVYTTLSIITIGGFTYLQQYFLNGKTNTIDCLIGVLAIILPYTLIWIMVISTSKADNSEIDHFR